jgi:hypothetical protein
MEDENMAATTVPTPTPGIAVRPMPRWAYLVLAAAVGVLWLVTFEGGVVSHALGQAGSFLHELFHDGRHLIGVPCH